jgi:hypothetical protein
MKTYGEVDVEIHVFLTLALVEGEWSASCPCYSVEQKLIRMIDIFGQHSLWRKCHRQFLRKYLLTAECYVRQQFAVQ